MLFNILLLLLLAALMVCVIVDGAVLLIIVLIVVGRDYCDVDVFCYVLILVHLVRAEEITVVLFPKVFVVTVDAVTLVVVTTLPVHC